MPITRYTVSTRSSIYLQLIQIKKAVNSNSNSKEKHMTEHARYTVDNITLDDNHPYMPEQTVYKLRDVQTGTMRMGCYTSRKLAESIAGDKNNTTTVTPFVPKPNFKLDRLFGSLF